MHDSLKSLSRVKSKINEIISKKQLKTEPKIIVVSKTFSLDKIIPILETGHLHYGENKIQEAEQKWLNVKKNYKNLQLHMVGRLQSNKAKKAVTLFDYIHSLDNERLAAKLSYYEKELNKKVKIFIQVNLGSEEQKAGVNLNNLNNFYGYCVDELSLNVIGLMCLPPIDSNPLEYFKTLKINAEKLNLKELSMGMSSDYEQAVQSGSSYLRLGTIILGKRSFI
jgi:PLP dependent protein